MTLTHAVFTDAIRARLRQGAEHTGAHDDRLGADELTDGGAYLAASAGGGLTDTAPMWAVSLCADTDDRRQEVIEAIAVLIRAVEVMDRAEARSMIVSA